MAKRHEIDEVEWMHEDIHKRLVRVDEREGYFFVQMCLYVVAMVLLWLWVLTQPGGDLLKLLAILVSSLWGGWLTIVGTGWFFERQQEHIIQRKLIRELESRGIGPGQQTAGALQDVRLVTRDAEGRLVEVDDVDEEDEIEGLL